MRFSEDKIVTLVCSDNIKSDIHIWQPDNPKAVFVAIHGGMSHAGDFIEPALYFKKGGYATVALDLHGHTRSEKIYIPNFNIFLDDLILFINWAKNEFPNLPLILLGHSMGSLILTHYGLTRMPEPDPRILGFVLSSPYYENAIPVPSILQKLSGVLSAMAPKMSVPIKDFTDELTHDDAIHKRIKKDQADNFRAKKVSARFGNELLKAQAFVQGHIGEWRHPLIVFIAGQDRLADSKVTEQMIQKIDPKWVEQYVYPDNYHENFNEVNREEIFDLICKWVENKLK